MLAYRHPNGSYFLCFEVSHDRNVTDSEQFNTTAVSYGN
jgi:hypothetical protein